MTNYKKIALISSVLSLIILIISSICGATMFGYAHTSNLYIRIIQNLFPLTYIFGGLVIVSAWKLDNKMYAIIGLLETLFLPLLLGLILNNPDTMWIEACL
ncbi:MAG: hypothetical protein PUI85_05490 [Eubacteriales bacterium]|nr:hypothetical protein [Eubacteriales bacterium]MDY3332554.1 hypothetical protein [Gallibacter sp.]